MFHVAGSGAYVRLFQIRGHTVLPLTLVTVRTDDYDCSDRLPLPVDQAIVQYTSNTRPTNGLTLSVSVHAGAHERARGIRGAIHREARNRGAETKGVHPERVQNRRVRGRGAVRRDPGGRGYYARTESEGTYFPFNTFRRLTAIRD